jgi:thioredoxin reductase (NADPH)
MLTSDVENFPGFDEPIEGPVLIERMRRQAERFGTRFVDESITGVDFTSIPLRIRTGSGGVDDNIDSTGGNIFLTKSVIIATGASAIWLVRIRRDLRGKGVSSCATCGGFFFKGKDVVVVGGGGSIVLI